MDSDDRFWISLVAIALSFLATVIIGCTMIYHNNLQQMAKLGYQEVTVVGSSATVWQKAK